MKPVSIVIITYNRPEDMVALARNIAGLQDVETEVEEIIIINNQSSVSYTKLEEFIHKHPELPFRYTIAPKNLGVSAGRNFAARQSHSPFLVFLDDDAFFGNTDALRHIIAAFNEPDLSGRIKGILAFKVFYQSTMTLQQTAFPHKNFQEKKNLHQFPAPYFAGCAHAIHRLVFEKAGYYPEDFFYGMEEYDLSYRALDAGFGIYYDDRVVVHHNESPAGRLPNAEKLRGMWVNKSKVAWKYLPPRYFYSTGVLWSFEYLKKSGFNLRGWFSGWATFFRISSSLKKTPVSNATLDYLKKIGARLWY